MAPGAVASAPPPAKAFPNAAELFHSLKRRWVLAVLVGGLCAAVAAVAVWMAMPAGKHQARATIRFKILNLPNTSSESFERERENLVTLGYTRTLMARVISTNPEVGRQPIIAQSDDKMRALEDNIRLKWVSPEFLQVQMNGDEPNQLLVILTAYVNMLVTEAVSEEEKRHLSELQAVKNEIETVVRQIEETRQRMLDDERSGSGMTEAAQALRRQLHAATVQEFSAKVQLGRTKENNLKAELDQVREDIKSGRPSIDQDLINKTLEADRLVADLTTQYRLVQAAHEKLKLQLQPNHPKLKDSEADVAKAAAALNEEKSRLRSVMETEARSRKINELQIHANSLANQLRTVTSQREIDEIDKEKALKEFDRFEKGTGTGRSQGRNIDSLEARQNDLLLKQSNLQNAMKNSASRIELKEEAQVIPNYNLKQKMQFSVAAGVAIFACVIGLIGLLEWRNRRVDGVEQVISELNMRVIGTIPAFPSRASLKSGEAGQNQNWRFILNESVNSTRTMLLHSAKNQQMQVLLVTSAMQGEGKTSLSSQLATSMATAGLRTLILDCDLRNPSMQKLFDIPVAPGCSEILLQEVDVSDVVQPTSVPNLWIIPAGQCNHRVVAALAQGHPLESLLNRLRGQFDFIVVDSCPILPVADTLLVAQHVDGVVFSILQDVSQLPKVLSASERLAQLNIPLLGAVVNGIKPDVQAYGYNYVKQLPA
jgi:capsular exopolysaccharide synthesis family protein